MININYCPSFLLGIVFDVGPERLDELAHFGHSFNIVFDSLGHFPSSLFNLLLQVDFRFLLILLKLFFSSFFFLLIRFTHSFSVHPDIFFMPPHNLFMLVIHISEAILLATSFEHLLKLLSSRAFIRIRIVVLSSGIACPSGLLLLSFENFLHYSLPRSRVIPATLILIPPVGIPLLSIACLLKWM